MLDFGEPRALPSHLATDHKPTGDAFPAGSIPVRFRQGDFREGRLSELFVPGRLCLFGEHSDWAAGYRDSHPEIAPGCCLVVGTDQGLRASPACDDSALAIEARLPDGTRAGPERIPLDRLAGAARGEGFFRYAAGTLAVLRERYGVRGLALDVRSDLPVRKGLSSSAATCVLVARATSHAYGLGLTAQQEMDVAYAGERRTGSECGRMDQVCALGRGPVRLAVDGEAIETRRVATGGRFALLVVDLMRGKDTRRILADLNACYPDAPGELAAGVRHALGELNLESVARAERALGSGDARALGAEMERAQAGFDRWVAPACPELAAPHLHALLGHPSVRELTWGGKGVGSQGDGCAQLVARGPRERKELAIRLERELGVRTLALDLGHESTASGARA
jgi:galactokinase